MELPVVSTAIPGCIDVVTDGETGRLVSPYDEMALTEAIAYYAKDPEARLQHGRAARERVLRVFRREAIWAALREEYERLLHERGVR